MSKLAYEISPMLDYGYGYCDEFEAELVYTDDPETATQAYCARLGFDREDVEHRRVEWADQYGDGPIPMSAAIANGYWVECCGCGMRLDECNLEDEGLDVDDVVGTFDGHSFCQQSCADDYWEQKRRDDAMGNAELERLRQYILKRMPNAKFTDRVHYYIRDEKIVQAFVQFKLKELRFPLELRNDNGQMNWLIANGDRELFNRLYMENNDG